MNYNRVIIKNHRHDVVKCVFYFVTRQSHSGIFSSRRFDHSLTTIVVINNGKDGLTDAEIDGFTYPKGLFLMYLVGNDEIFVIRLPPSPP